MGESVFALEAIDPASNPLVAKLAQEYQEQISRSALAADTDAAMISRLLSFAAEAEQQLQWARQRISDLEGITETDELTGLINRQGLRRQMVRTMASAHRHGLFGTVLFIDIDDLKAINQRSGRPVGDAVIRHVAKVLVRMTRAGDLVARYGGDEFALVLERCSQANAHMRAEAIAKELRAQTLHLGDISIEIGISFGMAPYGPNGTAEQVLGNSRLNPQPAAPSEPSTH